MTTDEHAKPRALGVGRMIAALVLGAALWGLVNLYYFWPRERGALELLSEKAAARLATKPAQSAPPEVHAGITFDEFRSFAREHGLKWRLEDGKPALVRFNVSNIFCMPSAFFKDGRLEQVFFGCMN